MTLISKKTEILNREEIYGKRTTKDEIEVETCPANLNVENGLSISHACKLQIDKIKQKKNQRKQQKEKGKNKKRNGKLSINHSDNYK